MRTAGFVLVGGRSSRMGQDKALLPWQGERLASHIARKVCDAAGNVALVGRSNFPDAPDLDCVPDLHPGLGPLSGIEAALASRRGDLNLIVSCDLPMLDARWLQTLLEEAESRQTRCLVLKDSEGRLHPLCGVYRSDCLPLVQGAVQERHLKLMRVIGALGAECLTVDEPLLNVNTPEEWDFCRDASHGR